MARFRALASRDRTKTLWNAGSPGTLSAANFADRAAPGGVGTLARTLGTMPPQSGDAIG
jgi:hypothetical protein